MTGQIPNKPGANAERSQQPAVNTVETREKISPREKLASNLNSLWSVMGTGIGSTWRGLEKTRSTAQLATQKLAEKIRDTTQGVRSFFSGNPMVDKAAEQVLDSTEGENETVVSVKKPTTLDTINVKVAKEHGLEGGDVEKNIPLDIREAATAEKKKLKESGFKSYDVLTDALTEELAHSIDNPEKRAELSQLLQELRKTMDPLREKNRSEFFDVYIGKFSDRVTHAMNGSFDEVLAAQFAADALDVINVQEKYRKIAENVAKEERAIREELAKKAQQAQPEVNPKKGGGEEDIGDIDIDTSDLSEDVKSVGVNQEKIQQEEVKLEGSKKPRATKDWLKGKMGELKGLVSQSVQIGGVVSSKLKSGLDALKKRGSVQEKSPLVQAEKTDKLDNEEELALAKSAEEKARSDIKQVLSSIYRPGVQDWVLKLLENKQQNQGIINTFVQELDPAKQLAFNNLVARLEASKQLQQSLGEGEKDATVDKVSQLGVYSFVRAKNALDILQNRSQATVESLPGGEWLWKNRKFATRLAFIALPMLLNMAADSSYHGGDAVHAVELPMQEVGEVGANLETLDIPMMTVETPVTSSPDVVQVPETATVEENLSSDISPVKVEVQQPESVIDAQPIIREEPVSNVSTPVEQRVVVEEEVPIVETSDLVIQQPEAVQQSTEPESPLNEAQREAFLEKADQLEGMGIITPDQEQGSSSVVGGRVDLEPTEDDMTIGTDDNWNTDATTGHTEFAPETVVESDMVAVHDQMVNEAQELVDEYAEEGQLSTEKANRLVELVPGWNPSETITDSASVSVVDADGIVIGTISYPNK